MESNQQVYPFYAGTFSQFYKCEFVVDGILFNCAEQYMMYKKAELFGDTEIAKQILKECKPGNIKALGRKVRNFDDEVWIKTCKGIVYVGNLAKFSQNLKLRERLLNTKNAILVEASPRDKRWGVGLSKHDDKIFDTKKWRGSNWLGEILMKVRSTLSEATA